MIAILSPSKTLDMSAPPAGVPWSVPEGLDDSAALISVLRRMSAERIAALMGVNAQLAELNRDRFRAWDGDFSPAHAKQAILAFAGDVYQGFELAGYGRADFEFAQKHLRILSGLHGVLRPLDLIQPYRLEMGTELKTKRGADLYAFWGRRISDRLNAALADSGSDVLVNLASDEYFNAVDRRALKARVVKCVFKERTDGAWKVLSFLAKRARGLMANFMVRERVTRVAGLRRFAAAGYRFDPASSTDDSIVFLRASRPPAGTKAVRTGAQRGRSQVRRAR